MDFCFVVCAWLLVVGCWLLVVGCWLLVVGCWLLVRCGGFLLNMNLAEGGERGGLRQGHHARLATELGGQNVWIIGARSRFFGRQTRFLFFNDALGFVSR